MAVTNSNFFGRGQSNETVGANGKPKKTYKMWCNVGKILPDGRFASMGGFGIDADGARDLPTNAQSDFVAIVAGGNQALRASIAKLEELGPGNSQVYSAKGMPFAVELRYQAEKLDESAVDAEGVGDFVL